MNLKGAGRIRRPAKTIALAIVVTKIDGKGTARQKNGRNFLKPGR
jgi:hypothetical protein